MATKSRFGWYLFASCVVQGMVNSLAENQRVWNGTVAAMSELDALMSLAAFAEHSSAWGPICRPVFVEPNADGSQVAPNSAL